MAKKIEIKVNTLEDASKRFIAAWHAAEKSDEKTSRELLTFENLETLLKVLTPKRLTLLKCLRGEGPMSIRTLSRKLQRDYSNVYTDVKQLEACGLIEKDDSDKMCVPWSDVVAHFSLVAAPRKLLSKKPRYPKVRHHSINRHKKAS